MPRKNLLTTIALLLLVSPAPLYAAEARRAEVGTGIVRNVDARYEAFGVKPTDTLYLAPDQRVRIW
jgi:hypothetical protein